MRPIYAWILIVALLLALAPAAPALAQTGNPPIQVDLAEPAFRLPPAVGALLILAIAVGVTVYKDRARKNRKKPRIDANT